MLVMKPYAWLKAIIKRFRTVANYCRDCGRETEPFIVPNVVWNLISPHVGPRPNDYILCIRDFTRRARKLGYNLEWTMVQV